MLSPLRRRRSTFWSIACALMLVMKAGVPVLAATAAFLQGKAVAEICAIYGVRTSVQVDAELARSTLHAAAPAEHRGHADPGDRAEHAAHASHQHDAARVAAAHAPDPGSSHGAAHDREHCALTGLAVCAVSALAGLEAVAWLAALEVADPSARPPAPMRDASARWLAARVHAPPFAA